MGTFWLGHLGKPNTALIPVSRIHIRCHRTPWFKSVWWPSLFVFTICPIVLFSVCFWKFWWLERQTYSGKRREQFHDTTEVQIKTLQKGLFEWRWIWHLVFAWKTPSLLWNQLALFWSQADQWSISGPWTVQAIWNMVTGDLCHADQFPHIDKQLSLVQDTLPQLKTSVLLLWTQILLVWSDFPEKSKPLPFSQPHQKLTLPLFISKHGSWLHPGRENTSPWYAQVGRGSFFYLGYSFWKNFPGTELAPPPTTHTHSPYKGSISNESKTQTFSLYPFHGFWGLFNHWYVKLENSEPTILWKTSDSH